MKSLRLLLENITKNYLLEKQNDFTNNDLAKYIRKEPKKILKPFLLSNDYIIKSSAGQTKWADVPWIVIFNKIETDGVQEGVYVAYLFSKDMKRIYLALMHGVERPFKREGKKKALEKINARTSEIRANEKIEGFTQDNRINLSKKGRGAAYSNVIIFHKEYSTNNLPPDEVVVDDLKKILSFYDNLLVESNLINEGIDFSGFSGKVEEGKKILKIHFLRERNQNIIKKSKEMRKKVAGEIRCDICNISFEEFYGDRGRDFIEGHHKNPISQIEEVGVTDIEDIALVCANCHRMIHRKVPWISVEELKETVKQQKIFKHH